MKILVTGAAGFIGSHIANMYADQGHEVFCVDNYEEAGGFRLNKAIKRVWCDIRDRAKVQDTIWDIFPDLISHQAALINPRRSLRHPSEDAMTNYVGTANILEAMKEYERCKLIFASSCAVYGNPADEVPMVEGRYEMPVCPYGVSKLASEKLINVYCQHHDLKAVVLRYPNIYGPGQSGERDTGVIAIFARRMAQDKMLTIFGSGEASYQYLHMNDLVDAHIRATEWLERDKNKFLLCNLPGENCTVMGIVEKLTTHFKKFKVSDNIRFDMARPGEQGKITMSGEGALVALGWKQSIPLDNGIRTVVKALKKELRNG